MRVEVLLKVRRLTAGADVAGGISDSAAASSATQSYMASVAQAPERRTPLMGLFDKHQASGPEQPDLRQANSAGDNNRRTMATAIKSQFGADEGSDRAGSVSPEKGGGLKPPGRSSADGAAAASVRSIGISDCSTFLVICHLQTIAHMFSVFQFLCSNSAPPHLCMWLELSFITQHVTTRARVHMMTTRAVMFVNLRRADTLCRATVFELAVHRR